MSTTPPLRPIRSSRRLRLLDDGQLADLRAASLEILDTIGFDCPSERLRRRYEAHGARVDHAERRVRLAPELVIAAMGRAPRSYVMAGRDPSFDLVTDGSALYVGTDGSGVQVIDGVTRKLRPSRLSDVADFARVADALPSLGFYWPIVTASDHPATAPLHELVASLANTVKHVQTETVVDAWMARRAVEMATVLAGSAAAVRARPPISSLICAISPLAQDPESMEAALVFAEAGIPVGIMSMANAGTTGPASIAGCLAQADAEIVAGLALIQLEHPGAPVFYSLMTSVMDPRTGGYVSTSMSGEVAYTAGVELAHAWGVPTLAGVFGTDAPQPGWQVPAESAVALTLSGLLGAETANGMGLLAGCTILYPEEIVLDNDLHERVRVNLAGLDTSRSALALDVIREVGPRGHFLYQPHTRDGLRGIRFSDVAGRRDAAGSLVDVIAVARSTVERLLREHHPEPLEDHAAAELDRILSLAGTEAETRTA
jgi:trimethylamine--corrinoid protein Co-methyltransferase